MHVRVLRRKSSGGIVVQVPNTRYCARMGIDLEDSGQREAYFEAERAKDATLRDDPATGISPVEICTSCLNTDLPAREASPGDGGARRDAWRWDAALGKVMDDPTVMTELEVSHALRWKKRQIVESFDPASRIHRLAMAIGKAGDVVNAADRKSLVDEWKAAGRLLL